MDAKSKAQPVVLEKTDVRYTMRVSLPLDRSMQKMAERIDGDAGKLVAHALTLFAIVMEEQRRGNRCAIVSGSGASDCGGSNVIRILEITDSGLPGDLEIVPED